ncbi:MAG: hypothetical protein KBD01_02120 [Acidobacteria bacterium]|nr:hypothetical protein [Acidobacteriota bacterium]
MAASSVPPREPDAMTAVADSLTSAWHRMTWLMFSGPQARPMNWAWWGLIALIAGLSGGGGNFNVPGGDSGDRPGLGDVRNLTAEPWFVPVVVALVLLVLALVLVVIYLQSRFRFVFLEGVLAGEPRIRAVFPHTAAPGLSYFVFRVALAVIGLLLCLPAVLLWIPVITAGGEPEPAEILVPILVTLLWLLPVILVLALAGAFVHAIALPYAWRRGQGFMNGVREGWALVKRRPGALLLFALLRLVLGIVGGCLSCFVTFCTCCIWCWPLAVAVGLGAVGVLLLPLAVVLVPLALVLVFFVAWGIAAITSPIPVFFRSWSYALVGQLDPTLGGWEPVIPGAVVPQAIPEPPAPEAQPPAEPEPPAGPPPEPEPPPGEPPPF